MPDLLNPEERQFWVVIIRPPDLDIGCDNMPDWVKRACVNSTIKVFAALYDYRVNKKIFIASLVAQDPQSESLGAACWIEDHCQRDYVILPKNCVRILHDDRCPAA